MSDTPVTSWTLAVLPIRNTVLLPYMFLPLSVARPQSTSAVEAALGHEEKTLVVVDQKNSANDQVTPDELYSIGTRAVIKRMARGEKGIEVVVQGVERVQVLRY